jgi:hypothetical protein
MRRFAKFRNRVLSPPTLVLLLTLSVGSVLLLSKTPTSTSSGTADSQVTRAEGRSTQPGCCGDEEGEQKPHLLAGSYYKVTDGFSAQLLLNNKGPAPIEVQPTLFSLNGQRFELPIVTAEANNHQFIDFRDWVALAGAQFSEGSLQVLYRGKDLELGVQIHLTNEIHSLSFEEKLTELGKGSTRLEGVWWLPSPKGEVSLVVSNTTESSLATVAKIQGESPRKHGNLTIDLAPHETRVVDIRTGILQREHGAMSRFGSISIEHNGTAGAVVARAMAAERNLGYSLPVQFSSPAAAKSNNLQGAGLRLADVRADRLSAKVVLHNASQAEMIVTGRVPYTTTTGAAGELHLPQEQLSAGQTEVIDVTQLLRIQGVRRNDVSSASLELQHTGDLGALITSCFSVTDSGNQVFRVPIWDVAAQRSATGGYPWYIAGDSSTVIYIKNVTDQTQNYRMYLKLTGGDYVFPLTTVAPHQTTVIDVRKLRDTQAPDVNGRTIPREETRGQVQWSSTGGVDRVLIGRSEQVDLVRGISSNYACQNCCPNNFYDGWLTPAQSTGFQGEQLQFIAMQQDMNCYGQVYPPYQVGTPSFTSSNLSICNPDWNTGTTTGVGPGESSIFASWTADGWFFGPFGVCDYTPADVLRDALCSVVAVSVESNVDTVRPSGTGGTSTATIKVATNPPSPNQNVQLSLSAGNSTGGHVSHSGTRPLGTLDATQGQTNSQGIFETTYHAPIFGGSVIVSATLNGFPASNTLEYLVVVPGLSEIGASADYSLVGQTTTHPDNHFGTQTAITNLPLIASDYLGQFPGADILRYNDLSLKWGGKFDLSNNWSATGSHSEHRTGINCDVFSGNVPSSRWSVLTDIFAARHSPNFGDETSSANHWHLRFSQ